MPRCLQSATSPFSQSHGIMGKKLVKSQLKSVLAQRQAVHAPKAEQVKKRKPKKRSQQAKPAVDASSASDEALKYYKRTASSDVLTPAVVAQVRRQCRRPGPQDPAGFWTASSSQLLWCAHFAGDEAAQVSASGRLSRSETAMRDWGSHAGLAAQPVRWPASRPRAQPFWGRETRCPPHAARRPASGWAGMCTVRRSLSAGGASLVSPVAVRGAGLELQDVGYHPPGDSGMSRGFYFGGGGRGGDGGVQRARVCVMYGVSVHALRMACPCHRQGILAGSTDTHHRPP